ncbi:Protein CLEC16A [Sarcoptes scabiei]|uniref:Protein CLEC16A n=1 Tax=Sarcoptes scabiei TaxID=52283 RepID=A0A834RDT2_SARSC|nr:Protein CLEC16A [Sarcoptes scabiei]
MLRPSRWFGGWSRSSSEINLATNENVHSLEQLKNLHRLLEKNQIVSENNRTLLVETLRQIAEILIWGDQNDSSVFDFFLEKNMLCFFLNIMKQKCGGFVCTQLLQTLNILFENIKNETSLYYLLSNNHVNSIIIHKFDFSDEEVMAYYISFLKTLSLKLNAHTIHFFFNEQTADFPLYTEAIKFFNHPEKMVRIAVRTLTLNVFKVPNRAKLEFIRDRTAAPYFSNLTWFIGSHITLLDETLRSLGSKQSTNASNILMRLDDLFAEHLDHLHYLNDIFSLQISDLNDVLSDNLFNRFIIPLYVQSLLNQIVENPNVDESITNDEMMKKIDKLHPSVALFLLIQILLIVSYESFSNRLIDLLFYDSDRMKSALNNCEFNQPNISLETAIEQSINLTSNPNYSDSNDSISATQKSLSSSLSSLEIKMNANNSISYQIKDQIEKANSLSEQVESEKKFETINQSPTLWLDHPFLVVIIDLLNSNIVDKSFSNSETITLSAINCDGYENVKRKSQSNSLTNNIDLIRIFHSEFIQQILSQHHLVIHDDRLILFSLALIEAIISDNKSANKNIDGFFRPRTNLCVQSQDSFLNTLLNSLLSIIYRNSSIRLITFELAVHIFRRLIGLTSVPIVIKSSNDVTTKSSQNDTSDDYDDGGEKIFVKKSLLTDHHLALIEQSKEDSCHLLRQYFVSIDKAKFLNLFEREAKMFFKLTKSSSRSSWARISTSEFKIWINEADSSLEKMFMNASLLMKADDIGSALPNTESNLHLRSPGMDYEKIRHSLQIYFTLKLLSIDLRRSMTDTIDEKLEDLVTILDEDQSAYSTVKLDNFIDLDNCDLNYCTVTFYQIIPSIVNRTRNFGKNQRRSSASSSTVTKSSTFMTPSSPNSPSISLNNSSVRKSCRFMAIVSELLILIEPDEKRYGWGVVLFIARLQDIEKILMTVKDFGQMATAPPLPERDDNKSIFLSFTSFQISKVLMDQKMVSSTSSHQQPFTTFRSRLDQNENIIARFQFADAIRYIAARNCLLRSHKKMLDIKITAISRLIDMPISKTNRIDSNSSSSSIYDSKINETGSKLQHQNHNASMMMMMMKNNQSNLSKYGSAAAIPGVAVATSSSPSSINNDGVEQYDSRLISQINANKKRYAYPFGYISTNRLRSSPVSIKNSNEIDHNRKKKPKIPASEVSEEEPNAIPLNDMTPKILQKNSQSSSPSFSIFPANDNSQLQKVEANHTIQIDQEESSEIPKNSSGEMDGDIGTVSTQSKTTDSIKVELPIKTENNFVIDNFNNKSTKTTTIAKKLGRSKFEKAKTFDI